MIIFILLTQRPLFAGSRNMIGIGIATAAAGIIVGTVSQTGVGLVLAELVEFLSARPRPAHANLHGGPQPHSRHGAADNRELYRRLVTSGTGDHQPRTAERPYCATHRRASIRLLFRHHGRCDAVYRARFLRGGGSLGRRSCRSCSTTTRTYC